MNQILGGQPYKAQFVDKKMNTIINNYIISKVPIT